MSCYFLQMGATAAIVQSPWCWRKSFAGNNTTGLMSVTIAESHIHSAI